MTDPRWASAYTLLAGGARGLIAGGYSYPADRCVATADEFDPVTRRFLPCKGRLNIPRNFAQASLLASGQVLISGGYNTVLGSLNTAELFDPLTQTFYLLPSRLEVPRELFTATLLTDGRVLLAGGFNTHRGRTQSTAEVYNPVTQAFTPVGTLSQDRFGADAVRLTDGRVLIVGGTHWHVGQPGVPLATAELYDPASGRFQPTRGPMAFARDRPTATLLPDGTVLVAGGQNGGAEPTQAELFDPEVGDVRCAARPDGLPPHGPFRCVPARRHRADLRRLERAAVRDHGQCRAVRSLDAEFRGLGCAAGRCPRPGAASFSQRLGADRGRQTGIGRPGNITCDRLHPANSASVNSASVQTPVNPVTLAVNGP